MDVVAKLHDFRAQLTHGASLIRVRACVRAPDH